MDITVLIRCDSSFCKNAKRNQIAHMYDPSLYTHCAVAHLTCTKCDNSVELDEEYRDIFIDELSMYIQPHGAYEGIYCLYKELSNLNSLEIAKLNSRKKRVIRKRFLLKLK